MVCTESTRVSTPLLYGPTGIECTNRSAGSVHGELISHIKVIENYHTVKGERAAIPELGRTSGLWIHKDFVDEAGTKLRH